MDKAKKKHQFQIRKVPAKRPAGNAPELYGLDVHSICLPSKNLHCDILSEEFNDQIIYSQAYQQLYSTYVALNEQRQTKKQELTMEIQAADRVLAGQSLEKSRLVGLRDHLYGEIETLREGLNEARDKNYNLRWEVYHQRGAHFANVNGYSFLQSNEMSYEQLLQMEEQMGNVCKGLSQEKIALLPTEKYQCCGMREICCICYEEVEDGQMVTLLECKHTHHCECLLDWLLKQRKCPICKQEVEVPQGGECSPLNLYDDS